MTEEEEFQNWFKGHWYNSSSTEEGRARKAWVAARDAYNAGQSARQTATEFPSIRLSDR